MICATHLPRKISLNLDVIYPALFLNHTQGGGEIITAGAARVRAYGSRWIVRHFEREPHKRFTVSLVFNEMSMLTPLCDSVWSTLLIWAIHAQRRDCTCWYASFHPSCLAALPYLDAVDTSCRTPKKIWAKVNCKPINKW